MTGKSVLIGALEIYKRWISPLLPRACRYEPSCSEYARDAVELHGARRGSGMALLRLLRCNPFSRGGFDPVPPPAGKQTGSENDAEKTRCHG